MPDPKEHGSATTGKKVVGSQSKNMPSVMTVFGRIDEAYRPALAAEVAAILNERSEGVGGASPLPSTGSFSSKLLPKKNRDCPAPVKLHSEGEPTLEYATRGASSGSPLLDRLSAEEQKLIASKVEQLETQLRHHDTVIEMRHGQLQDLVALRDLKIAQKKSRLNQLKGHIALNRQKTVTQRLVDSGVSNEVLNANDLVRHRSTPCFSPSGVQLPSPSPSPAILGSPALVDRWQDAKLRSAAELEQRAKVLPFAVRRREGRRVYPQRLESPFFVDETLPPCGAADAGSGEEHVKSVGDLHQGRKIARTAHTQWMLREAGRLKEGYASGFVFSNPHTALEILDGQLRATSTTPTSAASPSNT
jgi:hypothetical protein